MGKKVEFIAFSDLHIKDWDQHSTNHSRLFHNKVVLDKVRQLCKKYNCPVLFAGDLVHNPNYIKNIELSHMTDWFNDFKEDGIEVYAIAGNHDQSEKNTSSNTSPDYVNTLSKIYPNIHNLERGYKCTDGHTVFGIDYLYGNDGFRKKVTQYAEISRKTKNKTILLIHTDLPGATDANNREIGTVENIPRRMQKLFGDFDLVLSGHIHKYQELGKNIYMIGATHHQALRDRGVKMGVFKIYDDMTLSMVKIKLPEFKYIEHDETAPDGAHFYVRLPKPEKRIKTAIKKTNISKPDKLVKGYLKKEGIKDRSKEVILLKYLTDDE